MKARLALSQSLNTRDYYIRDWTDRVHVNNNGSVKTIDLPTAMPKYRKVVRVITTDAGVKVRVEGLPRELTFAKGELVEVYI